MTEKTTVPVKQEAKREVSALSRWDPYAQIRQMEADMERFLEPFWPSARWPFAFRSPRLLPTGTTWAPRMDMYKKEGNLVLTAELPGMKPEDVEVTVEEGDLILKGERKAEKEVKEEDYYRMERRYGSFYRRQPLPEGIKPEQIKATFGNGVLEVTIPVPSETRGEAQQIPIKSA
jgi:HSP20 family protein